MSSSSNVLVKSSGPKYVFLSREVYWEKQYIGGLQVQGPNPASPPTVYGREQLQAMWRSHACATNRMPDDNPWAVDIRKAFGSPVFVYWCMIPMEMWGKCLVATTSHDRIIFFNLQEMVSPTTQYTTALMLLFMMWMQEPHSVPAGTLTSWDTFHDYITNKMMTVTVLDWDENGSIWSGDGVEDVTERRINYIRRTAGIPAHLTNQIRQHMDIKLCSKVFYLLKKLTAPKRYALLVFGVCMPMLHIKNKHAPRLVTMLTKHLDLVWDYWNQKKATTWIQLDKFMEQHKLVAQLPPTDKSVRVREQQLRSSVIAAMNNIEKMGSQLELTPAVSSASMDDLDSLLARLPPARQPSQESSTPTRDELQCMLEDMDMEPTPPPPPPQQQQPPPQQQPNPPPRPATPKRAAEPLPQPPSSYGAPSPKLASMMHHMRAEEFEPAAAAAPPAENDEDREDESVAAEEDKKKEATVEVSDYSESDEESETNNSDVEDRENIRRVRREIKYIHSGSMDDYAYYDVDWCIQYLLERKQKPICRLYSEKETNRFLSRKYTSVVFGLLIEKETGSRLPRAIARMAKIHCNNIPFRIHLCKHLGIVLELNA